MSSTSIEIKESDYKIWNHVDMFHEEFYLKLHRLFYSEEWALFREIVLTVHEEARSKMGLTPVTHESESIFSERYYDIVKLIHSEETLWTEFTSFLRSAMEYHTRTDEVFKGINMGYKMKRDVTTNGNISIYEIEKYDTKYTEEEHLKNSRERTRLDGILYDEMMNEKKKPNKRKLLWYFLYTSLPVPGEMGAADSPK